MQTLRDKIIATFRGERRGKKVIFAPFENKVIPGEELNKLIKRGMAVIKRTPYYKLSFPNIKIESETYVEGDYTVTKERLITPQGNIDRHLEKNDLTTYIAEHFVKSGKDIDAYIAYINDALVEPDYQSCYEALKEEEHFFTRTGIPYEPLQHIIIHSMGNENFCYAWMDERDFG